jgi:nucleoside-diphosphate-sugar epimerase
VVPIALGDRDALRRLAAELAPTALVHAAATGMERPRAGWAELVAANVDLPVALAEAAAAVPGCRLVHVGSALAYRPADHDLTEDDPLETLHPYGATKAAADLLVRAAAADLEVPLTVLRPVTFTGPGDEGTRLFPTLLRAAAAGEAVDLSAGTQVRGYASTRDVAAGVLAAATAPREGAATRIYNLGGGRPEALRALVERVLAALGLRVEVRFGARPAGTYEPARLVVDDARARRELGWRPTQDVAHAVWQLARASFPTLEVREPEEALSPPPTPPAT